MQVAGASSLQRAIFSACFKIKEFFLKFGVVQLPLIDNLAFSAVKARLGGRVRLVVSGGAPLAGHVENFLKVTMCAPVTQVRCSPPPFSATACDYVGTVQCMHAC
jgi:long-chain acyl-CoA synthetase